jgi:glycosyltransferase involved in cell wall biosynthesis
MQTQSTSNNPVRIHWVTDFKEGLGNAFGYWTHNQELRRAVASRLDVVLDDNAPVAWWIAPADLFREPIPGKVNVLFTMFESPDIPPQYIRAVNKADWLVVPSSWVKSVLAPHFPAERITVIPHGVGPDFAFVRRYRPHNRPFRWLWVGAPNPRKGWEEVIYTWDQMWKGNPAVELYIKTTRVPGLQQRGNVIVDGRKLPLEDLVQLYHSAHGFLFPTRGEGFGLTLAEAMRTGLPCISTNYSGVTDFFDGSVGWPLDWEYIDGEITFISTKETEKARLAMCDMGQMVKAMLEIMRDYRRALDVGRRASTRIRVGFTWEQSAGLVVDLVRTLTPRLAQEAA